jgi:hypothetical protein
MRCRAGAVAALALLATGCYRQVPVAPSAAPAGSEVVVHLTPAATQRFSYEAGYEVRSLRGVLEATRADTVALSVWTGARYRGAVIADHRRTHMLSSDDVLFVARPVFDRGRTALLGAGIAAGLVLLLSQALGGESGGQPPPSGPSDPAPVLIPVRIR